MSALNALRYLGLALLLAAGAVLAACGGNPAPASSLTQQASSPVATPSLRPTVTPAPVPCTAARFFDDERRFAVELSNPVCLVLQARDGERLLVKPSSRDSSMLLMTAGENRYVVGLDDSPYGPAGCAADRSFSLELSVVGPTSPIPQASVLFACRPGDSPAVCAPGISREGKLQTTTADSGLLCLSWPDSFGNEVAYRVEITYVRIGRLFAYLLPGNTSTFVVPDEAEPRLSESLERCLERKDVTVSLVALGADGSAIGGDSFSVVAECRG